MQEMVAIKPTSVVVAASSTYFQSYSGGIMTNAAACGSIGNHSINIVGYSTTNNPPYWYIRNSWGTGWGEAGYGQIEMTSGDG